MSENTTVGILGGGITGLSVAYALQKSGIKATVYEKSEEVGGAIHSITKKGFLVEEGPNTLSIRSSKMWNLLDTLGLESQMVKANDVAKKRFIVKNKKPIPVPMSFSNFLTTPLISSGAKLRLLKEPFVSASDRDDESVATFIERRLGRQPLDYGINPFVSGIYAGDPQKLSIKYTFSMLWEMEQRYGSITRGMIKKERPKNRPKRAMISFREGNQVLPNTLADFLDNTPKTSTEILSITKNNYNWVLSGEAPDQPFETEHNCLISTLPTHLLPELFAPELVNELAKLPYAPVSVLGLGFESNQITHPLDGFGMLIPEVENYKTLGVLFSSTLFPNRAPDGHELLTCFIGGARNPELARKSPKELVKIVLRELSELLQISGDPVFHHHKYWAKAIPQYPVGYNRYAKEMNNIEKENPGLFFQGNFREGVSVPDCILSGFETAQKVITFIKTR